MKNFRSSLILALVVAGLFGFLLFGNRHIQGTAQRDQASLFPDLEPAKAEFLKITDPDGVVEVRKKDGLWAVTAPVATEADPQAVSDVLRALDGLRALRVIPLSDIQKSGETLQSWQLVPGVVRVEFSGPGFSGLLRLGRKTAVSNLLYAGASAAPDAPVVLLPATSRDDVDKKLADLRSRAALRFAPAEVAQCGLRGAPPAGNTAAPAAEIQLARSGPAKSPAWKLEKPLSTAAAADRVEKWLRALASLKVRQFVSDDASDLTAYGLNTPVSQIWVQGASAKAPETLLVGLPVPGTPAGSQGQVYAKRLSGDTVFTLAAGDVERLVRGLPETRDRRVIPFAPGDAVAVKVEAGLDGKAPPAHVVAAKKDNGAWAYDNGGNGNGAPSGTPDAARLGDFLQGLSGLEAAQIVSDIAGDLKPYGLERPTARVTVTLKKGDGTDAETVLLGKAVPVPVSASVPAKDGKVPPAPPALVYAKNADQPVVYAVPATFADILPRDAWQWLDARPVPGGPDASKIVRLDFVPDVGTPFHVARGPQGDYQTDWTGVSVVPAQAAAQAATVAGLRADRWLGPVQPAFGLAKPRWKVTVATADGPAYVLLLGAELPGTQGGHAAQVEGQPYAFALSPADYAALATQPFVPLPAPAPASASVPTVPAATSPR